MSKREKILIGLSILTVVYGLYVWLLASPQQAATLVGDKDQKELNAFILKIAEKTAARLSKNEAYALQKAQDQWTRDPLIQIEPKAPEEVEQNQEPVLTSNAIYTGFLRMGDKRLAIINGMEYEIGDILEPDGFIIRSISPSSVVIAPPGKKKKTLTLPLEETE